MFLDRLTSYIAECYHRQEGFVPDIVRLLEKYKLRDILSTYVENGTFQHRLHGSAYLKVNFTTVQFPLGTVEHGHTPPVGLE